MNDKIGKLPKISSAGEALMEILKVAKDKRGHLLLKDDNEWLELKMKVIKKLAKKGLIHIIRG